MSTPPESANGWRRIKLSSIGQWGSGGTPRRGTPSFYGGPIPWLKIGDLNDGLVTESEETITEEGLKSSSAKLVGPGTVLIAMYGSIGKLGMPAMPCATNQAIAFCQPSREMASPEFLFQLLRSLRPMLVALGKGGNQSNISQTVLKGLEVAVPPIEQQNRIVAQLQLSDRRAGNVRQHLVRARKALGHFRQSVLAAACSGRLTEDWRASNPGAESIDRALAVVRSHSRRRRQTQQAVDLELPDVPVSYRVHSIDEISTALEYGTSKRADSSAEQGVPILRMGNIQAGELDLSDLKFIERDAETDGLMLSDGDLLFNRTNSPELVGKSAVFHSDQPMTFASYLIRVIFAPTVAEPDFVNLWINSAWGKEWARLAKTDGVSQSNINGSKLGLMPVPLPPLTEQRETVKRALNLLTAADEIGRQIARAVATAQRLETAIARKALRGEPMESTQ